MIIYKCHKEVFYMAKREKIVVEKGQKDILGFYIGDSESAKLLDECTE